MSAVSIEIKSKGHYSISGEMTFETAIDLCKQNKRMFGQQGVVNIDLGQVTRVDSAGLACLLEMLRQAKKHNVEIEFENIQEQLKSLVRLSGLEKLIQI